MTEPTVTESKTTTLIQQPTVSISRKELKGGEGVWTVEASAPLDADWAGLITRIADARIHAALEDRRVKTVMEASP